jgi:hypothetical protein
VAHLRALSALTELHLEDARIGNRGAEILASMTALRDLHLKGNPISRKQKTRLSEGTCRVFW